MNNSILKFYVIGDPIDHSLSPRMQNFFLKKFQIAGDYSAKRVRLDEIEATLSSFKNERVTGINVTTPLKNEILKFVDELTPEAETIGSVNTIKFKKGKLIGHNTDAIGFMTSLQVAGFSFQNKNAIIIGAGGAARAVAVALIREQCNEIFIANRTFEKAKNLAEELSFQFQNASIEAVRFDCDTIKNQIVSCQLLVNATTVGMENLNDQSLLPNADFLHHDLLVYDLIYRPYRTRLIHQAESLRLPWINGLEMLIFQGVESLRFWMEQNLILEESFFLEIKNLLRREVCQE